MFSALESTRFSELDLEVAAMFFDSWLASEILDDTASGNEINLEEG